MKRKFIFMIPIGILVFIQLVRINTANPAVNPEKDYIFATKISIEIADIVTNSCYDCHSNQTKFPWYSKISPISWIIKHHINEGREHLNFSIWGDYSIEKQRSIIEECIEEIEENKMPLQSYVIVHDEARLTSYSKQKLIKSFTLTVQ